MVERETSRPSIRRQCELLAVSRSGLYYEPETPSSEERELILRIDQLHLAHPFYGSRKLAVALKHEGRDINRKRVQRLMRIMGLEAMAPKPTTSEPHPEHATYPYLLRHLKIERPNHVWAADITYIPMGVGHAYLVAVMDWATRRVLSWRVSNSMETTFCLDALHEALDRFGAPELFNTDQGSQFTSEAFTRALLDRQVKISMDGKGRWVDNVFVERLWRSLKQEEVYGHAYESVTEARVGIGRYFDFYNDERPHQALGYQTPGAFYDMMVHPKKEAA